MCLFSSSCCLHGHLITSGTDSSHSGLLLEQSLREASRENELACCQGSVGPGLGGSLGLERDWGPLWASWHPIAHSHLV